jgi:FtsP/CotA-like multicopper oxidase with cupredoxin domain
MMASIPFSRRIVLRGTAALGAAAAGGGAYLAFGKAAPSSPAVQKFAVNLPIPPVLAPTRSDAEADYYDVVQRVASVEILPGLRTSVWGYNGIFPGPTLRVCKGRTAVVRQTNRLSIPTVVHLHGGVTPSESDGFPTDLIVPDKFPVNMPLCNAIPSLSQLADLGQAVPTNAKVHTYPNNQRAATLWYHDHTMDFTGRNVYMGLAGFYLIEDDEERALNLPSGDHDT